MLLFLGPIFFSPSKIFKSFILVIRILLSSTFFSVFSFREEFLSNLVFFFFFDKNFKITVGLLVKLDIYFSVSYVNITI